MIGAAGMPDVAALLIKDAVGPYHPDLACGGDVEDGHMAAPVAGAAADHPVGAPCEAAVPGTGVKDIAGIFIIVESDVPDRMRVSVRINRNRGVEEIVFIIGADAQGR